MNSKLINGEYKPNSDVLGRLKKDVEEYKPEMIFISGGEPTENPLALFSAMGLFKSWGCKIGMSTNGTHPETLRKFVVDYGKVDYVAMDFKGDMNAYAKLGSVEYFMKTMSSWLVLREGKHQNPHFDYEIRTTLYPTFTSLKVLTDMARFFHKDERWIWQQFRIVSDMPSKRAKSIKPFSEEKIESMKAYVSKIIPNISVRYV
jgi:pyruvate-formate lyase-activating enzyme